MLILVLISSRLVDQEEGIWRPGATGDNQGQLGARTKGEGRWLLIATALLIYWCALLIFTNFALFSHAMCVSSEDSPKCEFQNLFRVHISNLIMIKDPLVLPTVDLDIPIHNRTYFVNSQFCLKKKKNTWTIDWNQGSAKLIAWCGSSHYCYRLKDW